MLLLSLLSLLAMTTQTWGQFIEGNQGIEGKDVYTMSFGFLMSGPNQYYLTWTRHNPKDNITSFDNTVKDANTYILVNSFAKVSLCDMYKELTNNPTMLYSCDVVDAKSLEIVARRRVSLSIISIISLFLKSNNDLDLSTCTPLSPYIQMNTRINFSVVGSTTTLRCLPNQDDDVIVWKLPDGTTIVGKMLTIDNLSFDHMDLYTCQLFSNNVFIEQLQSFVYPLAKDDETEKEPEDIIV